MQEKYALRMRVRWLVAALVWQYQMGLRKSRTRIDSLHQQWVRVFIDMKTLVYLAGAEVDYIDACAVWLQNTNQRQNTCGCGQSFH